MERQESGRVRKIIIKSLSLLFCTTVIVGLLFYVGIGHWILEQFLHAHLLVPVIGWISLWLALISFQIVIAEIFRAFHDIRSAALIGGFLTISASIILLACVWLTIGEVALAEIMELTLIAYGINVF